MKVFRSSPSQVNSGIGAPALLELGSASPHPNAAAHDVEREHYTREHDGNERTTIRHHAGLIGQVYLNCSGDNSSQDFTCDAAPP
jgi:hypothetical protein